jgi:phosphatidylserine decarboxylase
LRLIPLASDGWRFIIPLTLLTALFFAIGTVATVAFSGLLFLLTLFCVAFFRDFDRATVLDDNLIYSPGDGKVMGIDVIPEGEYKGWKNIRIFLSVFDGHIQRVPVAGEVTKIAYKKGLFLDARDPKAHFENEQNAVTIKNPKGTLVVTQIAGLIARRIVWWISEGSVLKQGERYGLIRFGSQVDVLVPSSVNIRVSPGQRVLGGESILATWGA